MGLRATLEALVGRTITGVELVTVWRTEEEASFIQFRLDDGSTLQFDNPVDTEYEPGMKPIVIGPR